jgi:hypothetical protein
MIYQYFFHFRGVCELESTAMRPAFSPIIFLIIHLFFAVSDDSQNCSPGPAPTQRLGLIAVLAWWVAI